MTFTQGAASAERVAAIFDQPRPAVTTQRALPVRLTGAIELRGVSLDYGRGSVLNRINLVIRPGQRVALLGPNGAGKSSLLAVIGALYQPTRGEVCLDGLPLSDLPVQWLSGQVSIVLQDTFLFSGTLADNIRYGRADATDADVARAANDALVNEFADRLPAGLDTEIADGGIGLSGGQRQRVGIARALLLDAPIVLLDEPTAGLDVHSEDLVVRALTRLTCGRTVVMTTHRPALIRLATHTVHLYNGRLASQPVIHAAQRMAVPSVFRNGPVLRKATSPRHSLHSAAVGSNGTNGTNGSNGTHRTHSFNGADLPTQILDPIWVQPHRNGG